MIVSVFFTACSLGLLHSSVQADLGKICNRTQHLDSRSQFLDFFQVTDGADITWLHAVNSPVKLKEGLSSNIMMFEADVLMRNNQVNGTPVMAHPPDVDSNLTLADFLNQTVGSTKGIKLDFKTIAVVRPSLKMLKNKLSGTEFKNPIWLNADILPGPCYDKVCTPVDHEQFLDLCIMYFPKATLSIGWTTGSNMTSPENYYNWTQVISMGKLVSQIPQPITFPMRAVLMQRSVKQVDWLLGLSQTFTITIWSKSSDNLNAQDLVALRERVSDKTRIYYDLPSSQDTAFKEALRRAGPGVNKYLYGMGSYPWKAKAKTQCDDVLVGYNSVMFSGDGGEVLSERTLYKVYAKYYLFVKGVCSFIDTEGINEEKSISISLHVANTTRMVTHANTRGVVTLILHSNGIFRLLASGGEMKEGTVRSRTGIFKFDINEWSSDGKQRTFECEITAQDSKGEKASISLTMESKPIADHLLMGVRKQTGAVLVEKVEVALAAEGTSGASAGNDCSYQTVTIVLCILFLIMGHK